MLIDKNNKIVFIHNPKTAGTAIHKTLLKYNSFEVNWGIKNGIDTAHLTVTQALTLNKFDQSYFKFSCVRNPYSRAISSYLEAQKNYKLNLSFKNYLDCIRDKKYTLDYRFIHGRPQYDFLFSKNYLQVDYIMKFENIEEDYKKLYEIKLNKLGEFLPLIIDNKSNQKNKMNIINSLDNKTIHKINKVYDIDFKTLQYPMAKSI